MRQVKESNEEYHRKSESHFDELKIKSNIVPTFSKLNFPNEKLSFYKHM